MIDKVKNWLHRDVHWKYSEYQNDGSYIIVLVNRDNADETIFIRCKEKPNVQYVKTLKEDLDEENGNARILGF